MQSASGTGNKRSKLAPATNPAMRLANDRLRRVWSRGSLAVQLVFERFRTISIEALSFLDGLDRESLVQPFPEP